MKMKKNLKIISKILLCCGLFFITIFIVGGASILIGADDNNLISNIVIAGMGSLLLLFVMFQSYIHNARDKLGDSASNTSSDNLSDHLSDKDQVYKNAYFIVIYLISLVLSCAFPLMPVAGWFYPAIGVALALFSTATIGIVSVSILITFSVLISQSDGHIFILYFMSSLSGIMVFQNIDKRFKVGIPTFMTLISLLLSTTAMSIMFIEEKLVMDVFVVPLINLFVTGIVLFFVLNTYSYLFINKKNSIYLSINDQEYTLLLELKNQKPEVYYNAIHVSYLCEKIGRAIETDVVHLKALGYYHQIGCLKGENTWETCHILCQEHSFPQKLVFLLKQYLDKQTKITSCEVVVLVLVNDIISTIIDIFQKNPTATIDYEDLIYYIIKRREDDGDLNDSEITLKQFKIMKKILIEETLYYDFLR